MAELILMTRDEAGYTAGDILRALNDCFILDNHAQKFCDVRKLSFNRDGLRSRHTLSEIYQENMYQYRFERIARDTVRRTNLITLATDELSNTPNANGEYIDVTLFLDRRKRQNNHRIFGTDGAEVWYGGRLQPIMSRVDSIWTEIEARTSNQKSQHQTAQHNPALLKKRLVVPSSDFSNAVSGSYIQPEYQYIVRRISDDSVVSRYSHDQESNAESDVLADSTLWIDTIIVKQRQHQVNWQNQLGLTVKEATDVLDKTKVVDLRDEKSLYTNTDIVAQKPREAAARE